MAGNQIRFGAWLDDHVSSSLSKIRDNFDRMGKGAASASLARCLPAGTAAAKAVEEIQDLGPDCLVRLNLLPKEVVDLVQRGAEGDQSLQFRQIGRRDSGARRDPGLRSGPFPPALTWPRERPRAFSPTTRRVVRVTPSCSGVVRSA